MYQLIAHDGCRFVKLNLMFANQVNFVKQLREVNKYVLAPGVYLSSTSFLVDYPNQLEQIFTDKKSPSLEESHSDVQGLPVKYTAAPKFV